MLIHPLKPLLSRLPNPTLPQVLLKPDAPPPRLLGCKVWPAAIPQYELGHADIISALEQAEAGVAGLWICGNYRTGVAFPDCVNYGYNHAKVVGEYLQGLPQAGGKPKEVASAA